MKRPYFIWDYDISEAEFKAMLESGTEENKAWAASRLINHAKWDDIWKYTTPQQISELFPKLSFWPKSTRDLWQYALNRWQRGV